MLWMVALVALLPLAFVLADVVELGWGNEQQDTPLAEDATGPDLLAQVMDAGTEAEPVWGAWVRVTGFDPDTDCLFIDTDHSEPLSIRQAVSAAGHSYLLLSDGTRIVLDRVAHLPVQLDHLVVFG